MREDELREHLNDWVRPAVQAPLPGIGALRRRSRQRKIRGAAAWVLTIGVIVTIGLSVNASLPSGDGGKLGPRPAAGTSPGPAGWKKLPGWNPAGWTPAGGDAGASVPNEPYYITLPSQPDLSAPSAAPLVVYNALTGKNVGSVQPPADGGFLAAMPARDDRTFVVQVLTSPGSFGMYELRLGANGAPGRLALLGTVRTRPDALYLEYALSPDASMLAIGDPADADGNAHSIEVISLAYGTAMSWSVPDGDAIPDSWAADNRTLAVSWIRSHSQAGQGPALPGMGIRLLDVSTRGTELVRASRQIVTQPQAELLFPVQLTPDGSKIVTTVITRFVPGGGGEYGTPVRGYVAELSARTGLLLRKVTPEVSATVAQGGLACVPHWTDFTGDQLTSTCTPDNSAYGWGRLTVFDHGVITSSARLYRPPRSGGVAW